MQDDFYIGYLGKAPESLARFVRRVVVRLGLVAICVAAILVTGQHQFAVARFDYPEQRSFEGVVDERPYPTLIVQRPGRTFSENASSRFLLVAPGKHGAESLLRGMNGKSVKLNGILIYRDNQTMLEVMPGSVVAMPQAMNATTTDIDLGPVTLRGEIVDSKCNAGVMLPGEGKVHRDCAVRCLSGGIPPVFASVDAQGRREVYIMVDARGERLGKELLDRVAEPLGVSGRVVKRGASSILQADASAYKRLND